MRSVCKGMAPNTRAASAASREFLQPKVDRIDDLAAAARAIDAAVQARAAADRHITDCQQGVRPHSAHGNRGAVDMCIVKRLLPGLADGACIGPFMVPLLTE